MKPIKSIMLTASALSISLGAFGITNQAYALSAHNSEYVENVDLTINGPAAVIDVHNVSANKHVNAVDLKVQDSSMEFEFEGYVDCDGGNKVKFIGSKIHFGPLGIGGFGQLITSASLHDKIANEVAFKNGGNGPAEAGVPMAFEVPLSKTKNAHPAMRVNALEEIEKKLQAHVNDGGDPVDFYKQDQEVVLQRPLSLTGSCGKENNPNESSVGFETKSATIKIKYKGDPAVNDKPVLNAQLANNMPNQVQAGESPLKITSMTFQPNMPHHIGACPGSKTIRVNYMGQGEGEIKIRVNDSGQTIYQSGKIAFVGTNGQQHHDFDIDVPAAQKTDLNKTFTHNLTVHVVGKDDDEQIWPVHYQLMDSEEWKHRCTPQLNPQIGNAGGGIGGYQDQNNDGGEVKQMKIAPAAGGGRPKRATIRN